MKKVVLIMILLIAVSFIYLLSFGTSQKVETKKQVKVEPIQKPIAIQKVETENYYKSEIPLSKNLQKYIYDQSKVNGLDYNEVLAVIKVESNYNSNLISETNDYGLMQINKSNFKYLKEELGITNFLDSFQNVKAGTYILGKLHKGVNKHHALMAYNMGTSRANNLVSRGITSSRYSRKVIQEYNRLKEDNQ